MSCVHKYIYIYMIYNMSGPENGGTNTAEVRVAKRTRTVDWLVINITFMYIIVIVVLISVYHYCHDYCYHHYSKTSSKLTLRSFLRESYRKAKSKSGSRAGGTCTYMMLVVLVVVALRARRAGEHVGPRDGRLGCGHMGSTLMGPLQK